MSRESKLSRVVGKSLGLFLTIVGLVHFALLVRLKLGGELAGDFKISLFILGVGIFCLVVGCASLYGSRGSSTTPDRELTPPGSDPPRLESDEVLRRILADLCKEAVDGSLMLDELHRRWPIASAGHEFLSHCFDDVEGCVEHMPVGWQTDASWRSFERKRVELDYLLLISGAEWDAMLQCRLRIGKRKDFGNLSLANELNSCLKQEE